MPSPVSLVFRLSKKNSLCLIIGALGLIAIALVVKELTPAAAAGKPMPFFTAVGPLQSSPIALAPSNTTLLNVNPEANSVTIWNVTADTPAKVAELAVGHDPSSVAIHPDGTKAYVANSLDGTVSVINLAGPNVATTFAVGIEPMAVALSPNGTRPLGANPASNPLAVVNPATNRPGAAGKFDATRNAAKGDSGTQDGDADDTDETVFVALFYAQLRPGKTAVQEGE